MILNEKIDTPQANTEVAENDGQLDTQTVRHLHTQSLAHVHSEQKQTQQSEGQPIITWPMSRCVLYVLLYRSC